MATMIDDWSGSNGLVSRLASEPLRRFARAVAVAVLLSALALAPAFGATWTVTSTGDDPNDTTTLRGAVAVASSGDTIEFDLTYPAKITLSPLTYGPVIIDKALTITGPGADLLAIGAQNKGRILHIGSGATASISELTLTEAGWNGSEGGAIRNDGTLTLSDCTVSNSFSNAGGGILNAGTLSMSHCTVSGNQADVYGSGAGIWNTDTGTLTMSHCTVSGNILRGIDATGVSGNGGGIYNEGAMVIESSTISGNSSKYGRGGGVYNRVLNTSHSMTMSNTTVSGNSGEGGAAVYNTEGALTMSHCTISGNVGGSGVFGFGNPGIYNDAGTVTLKSSILANNCFICADCGACSYQYTGSDCPAEWADQGFCNFSCDGSGTYISDGSNLSDDASCGFTAIGDLQQTEDGLGPLASNGGPTLTHALLAGSAAIDHIPLEECKDLDGNQVTQDQRGVARPIPAGGSCDIGAYEFADPTGPIASAVTATPNPASVAESIVLSASVDDSTTGGSAVASADFEIRDGATVLVSGTESAEDGAFDEVSEDVAVTLAAGDLLPGVYEACVRGTDASQAVGDFTCSFLVVYDPSAGFVSGGGWIDSPAGAYPADPALAGKASFGFVSKYKKGMTTPSGDTEFLFDAAGLSFESTSYEWLVFAGAKAQFKGVGAVNGVAGYGFLLTASDGGLNGGGADTFRLKIWDAGETVVYDNGADQELGGGSIVIHKN